MEVTGEDSVSASPHESEHPYRRLEEAIESRESSQVEALGCYVAERFWEKIESGQIDETFVRLNTTSILEGLRDACRESSVPFTRALVAVVARELPLDKSEALQFPTDEL